MHDIQRQRHAMGDRMAAACGVGFLYHPQADGAHSWQLAVETLRRLEPGQTIHNNNMNIIIELSDKRKLIVII